MDFKEKFRTCDRSFNSRPFWAWNCRVTDELVKEQLPYFQEMGMGGCVIHARTGLKTPFMGEEFLRLVSVCKEEAGDLGMKIWLYDDDRWPSGYGGGLVTKNQEYRAGYLVISTWKKEEFAGNTLPGKYGRLDLTPHGDGELAAVYKNAGRKGDETYYVYQERMKDTPWFNGQAYVDTMNSEAVGIFLDKVYKPFLQQAGQQVEAIFTDEPQVLYKRFYLEEEQQKGVWTAVLPFGRELKEAFESAVKISFWDALPLILWNQGDMGNEMRYWYHRICLERFADAYCDQVGKWCRDHGIRLAGHLRGEGSLESQTASIGEAMRNYREFQIPGVDILCDKREYNTLKQCQSVVRQIGRPGMCSEMYGVTGWDFSYAAHKLQGDWQAALGVTHRVHHLAWMSMEGEAKRDFPASIFHQLPWYREYRKLETYFGRLSMVLERGKPRVRLGVIHPVESFWMAFGVSGKQKRREELEQAFERLTNRLLTRLCDFDFISEALLGEQEDLESGLAGRMEYQTVFVPDIDTMRETTARFLQNFIRRGGQAVFLGRLPGYRDGKPYRWSREMFSGAVFMTEEEAVQALPRDVQILDEKGNESYCYLAQIREEEERVWLFLARSGEPWEIALETGKIWKIRMKGSYEVQWWNPETGEVIAIEAAKTDGWTEISACLCAHDSLLLSYIQPKAEGETLQKDKLESRDGGYQLEKKRHAGRNQGEYKVFSLLSAESCRRKEDNVVVLSQAKYRFQEGIWQEKEELLRLETRLRNDMNYPKSGEYSPQPWAEPESEEEGPGLELEFLIQSRDRLEQVYFAGEQLDERIICWDGQPVSVPENGWYVDRSIRKIPLPVIEPGIHRLTVSMEFRKNTHLEWCYLTGDFDVVQKRQDGVFGEEPFFENKAPGEILLKASRPHTGFEPQKHQGMPFYGGDLIYRCPIRVPRGNYLLEFDLRGAPLLAVALDGKDLGIIGTGPGRLHLGILEGSHVLEITAFGSRINTFGAIHNAKETIGWYGPGAWRSEGADFTYGWNLRDTGILSAPKLLKEKEMEQDQGSFQKVVW